MKAIWNDSVIAEADKDELIFIEQNWYFPPNTVNMEFLRKSDTPYNCPWKGDCQYYDVGSGANWTKEGAFCYPTPKHSAIDTVHKDFSGYMAFWQGIQVVE